jgi:hypothetical protein
MQADTQKPRKYGVFLVFIRAGVLGITLETGVNGCQVAGVRHRQYSACKILVEGLFADDV